jgi:hypothetical protein
MDATQDAKEAREAGDEGEAEGVLHAGAAGEVVRYGSVVGGWGLLAGSVRLVNGRFVDYAMQE